MDKELSKYLIPAVAIGLALIIGIGGAILIVKNKPDILGLAANKTQNQSDSSLIAQVGKLMELPGDETPTIATVTDISKLSGQPFFVNAKNGDRVLVYSNAKKAILFRPSTNKIIEVGSVNLQNQTQNSKFDIWNGINADFTNQMSQKVTSTLTAAQVITKANAAKNNYSSSLLIDLTGNQSDLANQIAQALNLKVSTLPSGEKKPTDADFLIIIGSDFSGNPSPSPTATLKPTPTATSIPSASPSASQF